MMMRICLGLLFVGVVYGYHVPVNVNATEAYHQNVGIPLAASIKAAEDRLFSADQNNDRIVGGIVSTITSHPYMAGLVVSLANIAGNSACGSSLISANRLVTAAHCWFDGANQAWQFEVVLASQFLFYGGTRISTSTVIVHPNYNAFISNIVNDIAVIYLPTSVLLSTSIAPVALPSTTDLGNLFVGEWATAVGYGKTSDLEVGVTLSTVMREVNIQVITQQVCQSAYGVSTVRDSNVCTSGVGNVGICGGDSGGPLTIVRNGQRVLIGVSSFVARGMCHLGFPSAFARVTSFYAFIVQNLI